MAGEDDVTIKLAADVANALRAFVEVINQFKDLGEIIEVVEGASEAAGVTTDQFLTTLRENLDKSGLAATELGQNFALTLTEVETTLKDTATSADTTAASMKGIGEGADAASGQLDLFGNAVVEGMGGASDAIAGTTEQAQALTTEFSGKLIPSAETAAGSLGPLFDGISEGAKGAAEGTTEATTAVGGLTEAVRMAGAEQLSFNQNVDAGTTATFGLAEAVSDLAQKRAEDAAAFATYSAEQKESTAEMTATLLEQGMALKDIAEKAGLSTDSLKLLVAEQDELAKKTKEADDAQKPFWTSWLEGITKSEVATVAWGVVLADTFKKFAGGLTDALTSLPSMVTHMAAVGDEAGTMANRLGLPVEAVAELDYIAKQSGTNMQGLARTIQGFGAEVSKTGSTAGKALAGIGLSYKQMAADGLTASEQVFKVIEQIKLTVPASEQASKAVEILGPKFRANTALMAEDIGELQARFHDLGGTDGVGQLAKAGDRWGDLMNDMSTSMDGFKRSISVSLLGPMADVAEFVVDNVHPAFLLFGSTVASATQAMIPLASQILVTKIAQDGLTATMSGLLKAIQTQTAAVWAQVVAWLALPWVQAALAAGVLLAALYKLIGGWEGLVEIFDTVMEAMDPLITFFKNVYDIVWILGEQAIAGLIEWVTEAIGLFNGWWESAEKGEGVIGAVWEKIKQFAEFALIFLPFGAILKMIWENWDTIAENVSWAYGKVKEFFAFLGKAVQEDADAQRKWHDEKKFIDEEQQKSWDTLVAKQDEAEASWAKYLSGQKSGSQEMLENRKRLTAAFNALTSAQRASIQAGLEDYSAKEVAEKMYAELGLTVEDATAVITRFDKAMKEAAKTAAKDPLKKLMEDAKELGVQLDKAAKAGAPMSTVLEQLGKNAAELMVKARLEGVFEKLPQKIKDVGNAWNEQQLDLKTDALTTKVTELSTAYSTTLTAGAKAASDAIATMQDDMTAAYLTGDEARDFATERSKTKALDAVRAQKTAVDAAADAQVKKIHETYEASAKEINGLTTVDKAERDKRLADLAREEAAEIEAATAATAARQTGLDDQLERTRQFYEDKKKLDKGETKDFETNARARGLITKKAAAEQLKVQADKLRFMRLNEKEFTKEQIRAQEAVVLAQEDAAKHMGLATKAQAELELQTQREKYQHMLDNTKDFTRAQILAQKEAVEQAKVGAGQMKVDWGGALDSITGAFEQLANISGDTFGGMMKSIGELVGQTKVMKESFGAAKDMFAKAGTSGGFKGIAESFGNTSTGFLGSLGGIMKGMGTIMPMAGAVISGVTAAIGIGKKLWDSFTTSKGEKAAKDVGTRFGATISEEMGDKIAKDAKEIFKGDQFAAELYNMSDIVAAAGGVTEKNFKKLAGNLSQTFDLVKQGKMTADQAREVMDKNFGAFADHVLKSGQIASAEFQKMIQQNAASGVHSKEVTDFVLSQADRLGQNLAKMVSGVTIPTLEKASDTIAKFSANGRKQLEEDYRIAKEGSDHFTGSLEDFVGQQAEFYNTLEEGDSRLKTFFYGGDLDIWNKQQEAIKKTETEMLRLERLTLASFNASVKGGASYLDALDKMGPALDKINDANTKLGREGSAAIQELLKFREVANANKDLVESAGSLNEVMLALSNVGGLTEEAFADLQAQGSDTFAKLTEAGFTEQQSLQQMKGFLENVRDAHVKMGLPIDENTQKMIDQAEANGILSEQQMSTNDIMIQGLGGIIEALGGKLPEAFKKMADAGVDASKKVENSIKTGVQAPLDQSAKKLVDKQAWAQYASNAGIATDSAKIHVQLVTGAVSDVASGLEGTDWAAWAAEAVGAADAAHDAIDGVSLGSSPGGIKEIPIKLREAMKAFKEWERIGVISAGKVKDAVEAGLGSGEAMIQGNAAIKSETIAKIDGGPLAKFGVKQEEAIEALNQSAKALADVADADPNLQIAVNVHSFDAADTELAMERRILPAMVKALRRGRNLQSMKDLMK